jgi:hypothetical protein
MKKRTQTLVIDDSGNVKAMYSEETGSMLRSSGTIVRAKKVSDVKFDPKTQAWVAIDRKSRKVVARDASRKECVRKEHAHYEKEIARGNPPW